VCLGLLSDTFSLRRKGKSFSFGERNKINSRIINFTRRDVQPGTRENGEVNGRPPADARCLLLASIHHAAKSKSFSPPFQQEKSHPAIFIFQFSFFFKEMLQVSSPCVDRWTTKEVVSHFLKKR
jgi:hypothetical protein